MEKNNWSFNVGYDIECYYCKIKCHNSKIESCGNSCNEKDCWEDFCSSKCINNHILDQIINLSKKSKLKTYKKGEQDKNIIQIKRLSENLSRWM